MDDYQDILNRITGAANTGLGIYERATGRAPANTPAAGVPRSTSSGFSFGALLQNKWLLIGGAVASLLALWLLFFRKK